VIARTFREVQAQAADQRADLAGQKERLEARLAELKRAIGRLARSGKDGALVAELAGNGAAEGAAGRLVPGTDGQLVLRSDSASPCVGFAEQGGHLREVATVDIRVPMEFKTRNGRKEIISVRSPSGLPPDAATTADVRPRSPLVVALARAYRWQRMLDSGEVKSLDELASANGVNRSYIGRILNLAGMAPDIIQAILQGREPSGLALQTLTRDLPVQWGQQRTALGLSGLIRGQHSRNLG
jgi:hypothetical protein